MSPDFTALSTNCAKSHVIVDVVELHVTAISYKTRHFYDFESSRALLIVTVFAARSHEMLIPAVKNWRAGWQPALMFGPIFIARPWTRQNPNLHQSPEFVGGLRPWTTAAHRRPSLRQDEVTSVTVMTLHRCCMSNYSARTNACSRRESSKLPAGQRLLGHRPVE